MWHIYTESPHYHDGKYIIQIREITYRNGKYYRDDNHNREREADDFKKFMGGYPNLSIVFTTYESAIKYKEYIENKYYNKVNDLINLVRLESK